jgi:hypothetical protein
MELATTIFQCATKCNANESVWGGGYSNPLFGWEGAVTHSCKSVQIYYYNKEIQTELAFSEKGSAAAAKLITLSGLDPASATPADMEKKDLRFFCSECVPRDFANFLYGRCAYSWRSGVSLKGLYDDILMTAFL